MKEKILLNSGWTLSLLSDNGTNLPAHLEGLLENIPATVPGTVHTDLLKAGLIDDPFYADNERKLQWISRCDWVYEIRLDWKEQFPAIELVFEGLDTAARIELNGQTIASANNMFIPYQFDVTPFLRPGNNELRVEFTSPLKYAKAHRRPIRQFPSARHVDRVFIRKAQYSFGWDWGPSYPTMGIWKPVYLRPRKPLRLQSIAFETLSISAGRARVKITAELSEGMEPGHCLNFRLERAGQKIGRKIELRDETILSTEIEVEHPALWWPAGNGDPALYDLTVSLLDGNGHESDRIRKKVGIRTVELVCEQKGQPAFRFKVNGEPVFLKGANWIPSDSFLTRVPETTYRDLIDRAAGANMNILRVWGGGIYEQEFFYELCDQKGILVWQDFMFACAAYPQDDEFIEEVKAELDYNIKRLRTHPAILIWCGNNENEWIWYRDNCGPQEDMPGYQLYHNYFPKWLENWDPSRPYWPSSPFGQETDPNDAASGNRHQWDIWSRWIDYTEVVHDRSLFVTEFGFQAPANYYTLKKAIPQKEFHPQSPVFEFHNKQDEGNERLFRFLAGHLPVGRDISSFIYLTQLNQALALKSCLEHWRLRWPDTAGSIIWQINDCWPVSSWSLVDSDLRPKLSWYAVRQAFADPLLAFKTEKNQIEVVLQCSSSFTGTLRVHRIRNFSGQVEVYLNKDISDKVADVAVSIVSIQQREIAADDILIASLYASGGQLMARNHFSRSRWKHLTLPKIEGSLQNKWQGNNSLQLEAGLPVFFLELRHPHWNFSDNGFILLPGETKTVSVQSPGTRILEKTLDFISLNGFAYGR